MIVFDGKTIDGVAPVKIEDIYISPIQYNPVSRPRAIQFGSEFVRMVGGTRTVIVSLAILADDMELRQNGIIALSEWAKSDKEYKLDLPNNPGMYLMAVCTGKPETSVRKWWENKLRLTFTCFDNPYWTSEAEKSVSCGTQFNVIGDAPPLMRIERTISGSAASNQNYSNGTQTMTFSTIPVGNMVIDLNRQTAVVGSSSIMSYYATSGSFIIPRTGIQTITGTGTVKYRERYE